MQWGQEWHELDMKSDVPDDVRTMKGICKMASSLIKCLKFTWDAPGKNASGMMPVLDCQIWIAKEERWKGIPKEICTDGEGISRN